MKQPYPAYRDSEVDCIGRIPEHWQVAQLGQIGSFSKGGGGTKADEAETGFPCVRYGDLYTRHEFAIRETRARVAPERVDSYTRLRYGDLLFAGSGETIEEIGKSAVSLMEDEPAFCGGDVILFRPSVPVDAEFLGFAADSRPAVYQKSCMGRGVTVMHIYGSELRYLSIPFPPLPEQHQIAAFLDRATARIDELVAANRLLIERLDEYRTALITRTVTKGLPAETARAVGIDPVTGTKPSGVDCIGQIPAHWDTLQLRQIGSFSKGGGGTKADESERGFPCVRYGDLYTQHEFQITKTRARIASENIAAYAELAHGDLLFAGSGETIEEIGKSAVNLLDEQSFCGGDVIILRTTEAVDAAFLGFATGCSPAVHQKSCMGRGVTVMHIYSTELRYLSIVLPPLHEQQQISAFLDRQLKRFGGLHAQIDAVIERLLEYRSSLVTAAVTGKIDVRGEVPAMQGSEKV